MPPDSWTRTIPIDYFVDEYNCRRPVILTPCPIQRNFLLYILVHDISNCTVLIVRGRNFKSNHLTLQSSIFTLDPRIHFPNCVFHQLLATRFFPPSPPARPKCDPLISPIEPSRRLPPGFACLRTACPLSSCLDARTVKLAESSTCSGESRSNPTR